MGARLPEHRSRRSGAALALSVALHGAVAGAVAWTGTPPPPAHRVARIDVTLVEATPEPKPEPGPAALPAAVPRRPSGVARARRAAASPAAAPPSVAPTTALASVDPTAVSSVEIPALAPGPEAPIPPFVVLSPEAVAAGAVPADTTHPAMPRMDVVPPAGLDPLAPVVDKGGGRKEVRRQTFTASIASDGSISFGDLANLQSTGFGLMPLKNDRGDVVGYLPALGGRFDITDWAMRKAGMDPYSYEKRRVLEATRPLREQMAARDLEERTRRAIARLPALLDRVWLSPAPAAERRAFLFQLWDECAEEGSRADSGRTARATIEAYIARVLPEGDADAFAADEIARYNGGRRSRVEFTPYRRPR